jgi:glycyl-tRNA synthetase beta chain
MIDKKCILEIGTEELPFSAQKLVLNEAENILTSILKDQKISFDSMKILVTPCRIVVNILGISENQISEEKEILGPPKKIAFDENGNPTKALLGFVEKSGIKLADLREKETERGTYLSFISNTSSGKTKNILPKIFIEFISKLPFAKMMTWNETNFKFIRPIRWTLAILENELIDFEIAGIKSGKATYKIGGYRAEKILVENINEYFEAMKNADIFLDYKERKETIKNQIAEVIKNHGKLVSNDEDLLDEVTALVEYPTAVLCQFDEKFLDLPFEVIYTVLKNHQKCFALQNEDGKLINFFVAICNGKGRNFELVKTGYEKVAVARLNDAVFFFEKDKKIPLEYRKKALKNLVYQEKLGSVYDKVERIKKVAEIVASSAFLDSRLRGNDEINSIIELCKNDLVTDMVNEFPELQGTMGKYYAKDSKLDDKIATAIEEHYLPRFAGDKLPTTIEGAIVSISDKIDNIISTFLLDKKPTGSKDPFGIRRQVNGILNILKFNDWCIDLNELITESINIFADKFDIATIEKTKIELQEFLHTRLENWLIEEDFRIDVVRAGIWDKTKCNVQQALLICKAITEWIKQENFVQIIALFKRANNILKQAKVKNIDFESWEIDENFFVSEEKSLFKEIKNFGFSENFDEQLNYLELKNSLDAFFDKIMVMDEDEMKKKNRLALLSRLVEKFNRIADFSELSVGE